MKVASDRRSGGPAAELGGSSRVDRDLVPAVGTEHGSRGRSETESPLDAASEVGGQTTGNSPAEPGVLRGAPGGLLAEPCSCCGEGAEAAAAAAAAAS